MSFNQIRLSAAFEHKYQLRFNKESWCISELYWSQLKHYDTKKTQKAVVTLNDSWEEDIYLYTDWSNLKGINMPFNFEQYFNLEKQERKRMQLEVLHSGMVKIAEKEGWEMNPLLDAYNGCLKKNLEYNFLVGDKLKSSPDRKFQIGFWCNWDIDKFEVYWVLFDKNKNEVIRQLLIEKETFMGEFIYYVSWKWKDKKTILLEDKYKYGSKEKWEFVIPIEDVQ